MAILALLGGGDDLDAPFTNPAALRKRLSDALTGELLDQSLVIADQLEVLLDSYRSYADATVDTYIEESARQELSVPQLVGKLKPADEKRMIAMEEVIALRQDLLGLLSDRQWESVFG